MHHNMQFGTLLMQYIDLHTKKRENHKNGAN